MSTLVVGSVALDTVETPFGRAEGVLGGSASFFAAAASLYQPVQVVAVVGDDFPLAELEFLRDRGADLSGLQIVPGESFRWGGAYNADFSERETLFTTLGVFADFSPRIPAPFREARIVSLGNIHPVLQAAVLDQVSRPELVVCDTMNYWIEREREALMRLLQRIDLLMVNDSEIHQLSGIADPGRAAHWVRQHGPRWVVVKEGARGALLFDDNSAFRCPAYPVSRVVDPTGAGDAFAGGFAGYLAGVPRCTGEALRQALVHASVMGSFAVERFSLDRFRDLDPAEATARVGTLGEQAAIRPPAGLDYRTAGVDLEAADRAKQTIKSLVASTHDRHTLSGMGSFGGMYAVPEGIDAPVLVSSADGVGTKLKVAFLSGRHDTVGADLVNHCVNDILVQGARPLFFLDYLATGGMDAGVVGQVVSGVARACHENGCALLGGETAQMPDFYAAGEYDLAGFIVGIAERAALLDGSRTRAGDALVALASTGLHTNGYTLARRIVFDVLGLVAESPFPDSGATVAETLLAVHRSYLGSLGPELERGAVRALAHVTGGGIPGNLPRSLGPGLGARVDTASWQPPGVFAVLAQAGGVEREEMYRVFNMGVGMLVAVAPEEADGMVSRLRSRGEEAWIAGEIVPGSGVELG